MNGCSGNKKIIKTKNAPGAIGPYSQAVEANGFLFLSGQIPVDPATAEIVSGDIKEQTEQVIKNLKAVLESVCCDLSCVVKTTVFLKSMDDFAEMNSVYSSFFNENPPARACVQAAKLPKDVLVEIDLIAVK